MKQRKDIDWKNDEHIIDFVTGEWDKREKRYAGMHKSWMETIATYRGFIYHSFDSSSRQFADQLNIPEWRVRLLINLQLPRVRKFIARFSRTRPIWDVIPATQHIEDIEVAKKNKKVLQSLWYQKNYNYKIIEILTWIGLTGNAFSYVYWNPLDGPIKTIQPEQFLNQELLQDGSADAIEAATIDAMEKYKSFLRRNKGPDLFLGDVASKTISPFDIYMPTADSFEDVPWIIIGQVRDESFYRQLGMDTSEFATVKDSDVRFRNFIKRMHSTLDLTETITAGGNDPFMEEGKILELHYWSRPNNEHKRGYHCVVVGGKKVMKKGDNPYAHRDLPVVKYTGEKSPGTPWGFSAASQVVPLIREYNKTKSMMVEVQNLTSMPKWLVSRHAGIDDNAINNEPGEVIEYNSIFKPEMASPPNPPRFLVELLGSDLRDIDEIVSQQDALKGINPSGSRSGTMLAELKDSNEGDLSGIGLDLDEGFSRWGRLTAATLAQFLSEDRVYSYTGDKGRIESAIIQPGGLTGRNVNIAGADYFNIRVNQFSQFSLSRVGQTENLKVLLQYNLLDNREQALRFLDAGFLEDQLDPTRDDRSNQHLENLMMEQGQPVPVRYTDSHATHIDELKRFIREHQFDMQPQVYQIFMQHLLQHEELAVAEIVKPQVLMTKAMLLVAQLHQIPPQLIGALNGNGSDSGSSSGGGRSKAGGNKARGQTRNPAGAN